MIVHDSWWSNGSARITIIDYHEPFDQGLLRLGEGPGDEVGESRRERLRLT